VLFFCSVAHNIVDERGNPLPEGENADGMSQIQKTGYESQHRLGGSSRTEKEEIHKLKKEVC
jgi:hypothetical protein